MSNLPVIPTLLGVIAGAIGVAGYHKASTLQEEVHHPKVEVVDKASHEALQAELRRLEARVALLELRARSEPHAGASATPAPSPTDPADPSASTDHGVDDVGPAPKDPRKREERKQRVVSIIDSYWKAWGAKHGLSAAQTEGLSAMQAEAAKRRLDNQTKLADHEITQPQGRADNEAAAQDVRRKARALLTPDQFTQFEAEKGAEWGSSYRKIREAQAKAAAPAPAP